MLQRDIGIMGEGIFSEWDIVDEDKYRE